jgi:hypothetical protein
MQGILPRFKVRKENEKILLLEHKVISQGRLAGKLGLEISNLNDEALTLFLVLLFQLVELTTVTKIRSAQRCSTQARHHLHSIRMILVQLGMLTVELLVQETYLSLSLFLGSLSLRQFVPVFLLQLLFLDSQSFEITSECLGIPLDTSEISFQGCNCACHVGFLHRHTVFLLFATLQFVGLIRERMPKVVNFS